MRLLFLIVCIVLVGLSPAMAEPEMEHDASQPIHVTSQRLEANDAKGFFIFTGEVQAQQGDVTIYAQKMTIYYSDGEQKQVDRVVAEQDVRIVQLNRVATGQKAIFWQKDGRVELTGDPRVVQGENVVEGEKIIVYLNDSRSIVEGGKQGRVKAVFVPGESTE
ncbi:lipopolysaccharide transport periplasmic protein LptA [uncultured Desulfuromonas sp.]|uniref:lipopolysaccharide transport periplasmic protein LptA n=1 Tax=uncultured Desulfuromonas sp. TaxID=181013 RepID=UPI002AABD380|nr:lipopolysaccharide transport periplasmic protein LptA [uncultured Desulfuromonas sp.]